MSKSRLPKASEQRARRKEAIILRLVKGEPLKAVLADYPNMRFNPSTWSRLKKRYEREGFKALVDRRRGVPYKLRPEVRDFIIATKGSEPRLSLRSLAERVKTEFEVSLSTSYIYRILRGAGISEPLPVFKRTKELAVRDELTGLYNEKYMRERLSEEIKRAIMYQFPCSFVMLNIDDFKKYQRDNGEPAGNNLLKKVAVILKDSVEEVEKELARIHDDAFAIILPKKTKGEAKEVAEKIRKEIEKSKFLGAETQPLNKLTVSAGVSANPIDGITTEDLINKALVALIRAKRKGKNRVEV